MLAAPPGYEGSRAITPSLQNQYYQSRQHNGRGAVAQAMLSTLGEESPASLRGSASLPQLGDTLRGKLGAAASSAAPLSQELRKVDSLPALGDAPSAPGLGRRLWLPELAQQRNEQSADVRAEARALSTCQDVLRLCEEFEQRGCQGHECNSLKAQRRPRGLDLLYNIRSKEAEERSRPTVETAPPPQEVQATTRSFFRFRETTSEEAAPVLEGCKFFQQKEASSPGVTAQLAKAVTTVVSENAGQVVFRQGDPAGHCYVLMKGRCEVLVVKSISKNPSTPRTRFKASKLHTLTQSQSLSSEQEAAETARSRWKRASKLVIKANNLKLGAGASEHGKEAAGGLSEPPRYSTTEGFSTFAERSRLGDRLAVLEPGAVFGEQALSSEHARKRNASVRCVDDCDFLLVDQQQFKKVLCGLGATMQRALDTLERTDYFREMERDSPGVLQQLASVGSCFVKHRAGQVMFRQGDRPEKCYVIVSGQASAHIAEDMSKVTPRMQFDKSRLPTLSDALQNPGLQKRAQDEAERVARLAQTARQQGQAATEQALANSPKAAKKAKRALEKEKKAIEDEAQKQVLPRYLTAEGFNSFSTKSRLGKEVATMSVGTVFGELALMNDGMRASSCVCTQDCELLVLSRDPFRNALREVNDRIAFFMQHLPLLQNLKYTNKHPVTRFSRLSFAADQRFLFEGVLADEAAVFLVKSGSVELRRYRKPGDNPAYVLAAQPLAEAVLHPPEDRPPTPMGAKDQRPKAPWASAEDKYARDEEVYQTFEEGSFFCNLAFFPLAAPEPFTAAAGPGGCEVYRSSGVDAMVNLPEQIRKHLRQRLIQDTAVHLHKLCSTQAEPRKGLTVSPSAANLQEDRFRRHLQAQSLIGEGTGAYWHAQDTGGFTPASVAVARRGQRRNPGPLRVNAP
mmetsp:Transcript_36082/g.78724  ORF Transcript_36082/g.78724 Transcript_36082/m.78724 type:complete len:910 (+) Transcript_36082:87-2816(+)